MANEQEGGAMAAPPIHEGIESRQSYLQRVAKRGGWVGVIGEEPQEGPDALLGRALKILPAGSLLAYDIRQYLRSVAPWELL